MNKFKENCLPVVILLIICMVCVGLLAVLNDVLYVTDAEKFNRAMRAIYPDQSATFEVASVDSSTATNAMYGNVKAVTAASDGGYVVEALGTGGFQSGSVTLYVAISPEGTVSGWSIKENVSQSYIGKITAANTKTWYIGSSITMAIPLTAEVTAAGATMSSTAVNNAMNMACEYARKSLGLVEDPEVAALKQIKEGLADTAYAEAELTTVAPSVVAHLTINETAPLFAYTATANEETMYALVYTIGGANGYVAFVQNYVDEDRAVLANSDNITEEMIEAVTAYYFDLTACVTNVAENVYTVTAHKPANYTPNTYTLDVTVDNGVVTAIDLITDGWVEGIPQDNANKLVADLVGATSGTVDGIAGVAGATESANIIRTAVKTALNYAGANVAIEFVDQAIDSNFSTTSYGEVTNVAMGGGMYSITSKGNGGFGNGDITANIVIDSEGTILSIEIVANTSQSYIDKLTQEAIDDLYVGKTVSDIFAIDDVTVAGATMSSTALMNAVNTSANYARNKYSIGVNPEQDALDAIAAGLADTDYAGLEFTSLNAAAAKHITVDGANASFWFTAKQDGATINALTFVVNDEIVYIVYNASTIDANRTVIAKSENMTDANATLVTAKYFDETSIIESATKNADGSMIITATGNGGFSNGTITATVEVGADGTITTVTIDSNVGQSFIGMLKQAEIDALYVGKSVVSLFVLDDATISGATMSSTALMNAVNAGCKYAQEVLSSSDISVTATGNGGFGGGSITATITVNTSGVITSITIDSNVGQSYISKLEQDKIDAFYVGKSIYDTFVIGDVTVSGATMSSTALMNAVNDACLQAQDMLK